MQPTFRLHFQEIIDFLDTIVIKFDPFIEQLNTKLEYSNYTIDEHDPLTFPYYRILLGDATFASTPIYGWVPSLQTEVLLTRASVIAHPDLYNFYKDKLQLSMLLKRYPEDQFLIKRILDPVLDITSAIESPNLTRLPTSAVDTVLNDYERSDLVNFLDSFLTRFEYRWYISTFDYEDLYPATYWALLWNVLPYMLLSRRIINIRTNQVHSYYIWEYLTSVGFGSYRAYLNRRQELFLYRNNDYLKFNVGKKSTLEILSDVFLTPVKYSLSEKMIVSHTNDRETTFDKIPEIVPRVEKQPEYQSSTNFDYFLGELANNNLDPIDTTQHRTDVTTSFTKSSTNELMTKFIELVRNISGFEMMLLVKFIFDSTTYLASTDKLNTDVVFTSPVGGQTIQFASMTDALNLFYYCIYNQQGAPPVLTPTKYTSRSAVLHSSPPVISGPLFFDGIEWNPDSYVDEAALLSSVPYITENITSPIELSEKLGMQYQWIFSQIDAVKNISDTVSNLAIMRILDVLVPTQVLTIPQTYSTYTEYFARYPEALAIVNQLTGNENYTDVLTSLFESICPLAYGFQSIADDKDAASVLIFKIKEVFTYLTSYNVTFFTPATGNVDELTIPLLTESIRLQDSDIFTPVPDWWRFHFDYQLSIKTTSQSAIPVDVTSIYELDSLTGYGTITIETEPTETSSIIEENLTIYFEDHGSQATITD